MEIIVVGCGRLGSALVYRLHQAGHKVAVIDAIIAAFSNLPADFSGRTHEGDALSQDVLIRAGIETADAIAAVTSSDALNAVVGHVARTVFGIKKVVVRNYDPQCRLLFEDFGLQVISSTSWGAQRIEEMLATAELQTVFSAGNGEIEVYEFAVPIDWRGKKLKEFLPIEECTPISITRAGRAILPDPETTLAEGDLIHVSATDQGSFSLREKLQLGKGA
jgi:trk system potassium uptake protein